MFRSIISFPKAPVFEPAVRLFFSRATRNALKINLAGNAEAFKQTLQTKGEGIETHTIKVSYHMLVVTVSGSNNNRRMLSKSSVGQIYTLIQFNTYLPV